MHSSLNSTGSIVSEYTNTTEGEERGRGTTSVGGGVSIDNGGSGQYCVFVSCVGCGQCCLFVSCVGCGQCCLFVS